MKSVSHAELSGEDPRTPALSVARRRWWIVLVTAVVAVGITAAVLAQMTPTYTATSTLRAPITSSIQTPNDLTYIDRSMNTYKQIAEEPSLLAETQRAASLNRPPSLNVTIEPNTELLQLSASSRSPSVAQHTANTAARVLVAETQTLAKSTSQTAESSLESQLSSLASTITQEKIRQASLVAAGHGDGATAVALQQQISDDNASYQALVAQRAQQQLADALHNQTLSIIEPASKPSSPSSPKWKTVLGLALGLGLLGGLGLVFLLERIRPRAYTVEGIATAADADVLAAIPRVQESAEVALYNGGSPAQEAFSVLAVQVLADAQARDVRVICVTSPAKGDGKSTVAANLASELARSGRSVVLVDGDMRIPSVQRIFRVRSRRGLSTLLADAHDEVTIQDVVVHPVAVPDLAVIPAGPSPDAPARLLASRRLGQLLDALTPQYEFVVFDAPPLTVGDPLSIARFADVVLLVVGGEAVPDRDIQAARSQLRRVGAQSVSVVVNRWRSRETAYSYAYGKPR